MPSLPTPGDAAGLSARELAAHIQTDVTPDDEIALAWAELAYARALDPLIQAEDPTLAGEVARNAALRSELYGSPVSDVTTWMRRSYDALRRGDLTPQKERELAASHLVRGRILHQQLISERSVQTTTATRLAFASGDRILQAQHTFGARWDRYGTMNARHWATFEANDQIAGTQPALAVVLALRGMWRALRADHEGQHSAEHRAFVKKQVGANALAGFVAMSRPIAAVPGVRGQRLKARERMLS